MITGPAQIASQDLQRIGTTKLAPLGTLVVSRDGNAYRYGLAGASNLTAGQLSQQAAVVANHQNIAVFVAGVIGDRQIQVTLGATATTIDQYADGRVLTYDVSGTGQSLLVATNPVIALSTSGTIFLEDPLNQAILTTGKVNLSQSPYYNALIYAHTATTGTANGVAVTNLTAANYGFFQTKGLAAVLGNGSITKGSGVVPGQTTDGSVDIEATGTITQRVGWAYETGTSAKYNTTYLNID